MNNYANSGAMIATSTVDMPWMNPALNLDYPDPGEAAKSAKIVIWLPENCGAGRGRHDPDSDSDFLPAKSVLREVNVIHSLVLGPKANGRFQVILLLFI